MLIAHKIEKENIDLSNLDFVLMNYDERFIRRKKLVSNKGEPCLVELSETKSLDNGDAFVLNDGRKILVKAAEEKLLEIKHINLSKIAWHIGNRHTPCQILENRLLIQDDVVMRDLLKKLGAKIKLIEDVFLPEGGAYGHGRTHSHKH